MSKSQPLIGTAAPGRSVSIGCAIKPRFLGNLRTLRATSTSSPRWRRRDSDQQQQNGRLKRTTWRRRRHDSPHGRPRHLSRHRLRRWPRSELPRAPLNHARRLDPSQLRTAPQNDQHQPLHGMVNCRHDSLALLTQQWLIASSASNADELSNFTSAVPNRTRLYGARKERLLGFLGVRRATRATSMRWSKGSLMLH